VDHGLQDYAVTPGHKRMLRNAPPFAVSDAEAASEAKTNIAKIAAKVGLLHAEKRLKRKHLR